MARLQLHFPKKDNKHPAFVEDDVPAKGTSYTIHGANGHQSFIVSLVRRQLWPKTLYDNQADPHEYLAGGHWEVLLIRPEDFAEGKM